MLIAGCAAWGTMIGAMWYGAQHRGQYNAQVTAINAAGRPPGSVEGGILAYHDRQGSRSNTSAIVSAGMGTTLSIVGAALLGRGVAPKHRQGRRAPFGLAMTWRPGL